MVSVTHGHNLQILTAEHGSFPWFSQVLAAEWRNGGMAEWQNGGMAEWRNGKTAEWLNGGLAGWQNGGIADGTANCGMARMAEWQNGKNGGKTIHTPTQ